MAVIIDRYPAQFRPCTQQSLKTIQISSEHRTDDDNNDGTSSSAKKAKSVN